MDPKNTKGLKILLGWTKNLGHFSKNCLRSTADDKIPQKSNIQFMSNYELLLM